MFRSFLERLGRGLSPTRTAGLPTSSNKASSFHLFWDGPPEPLIEVRATIEVVEPPTVDRLYFWAIQANFSERGANRGGAHFGLQHHPSYPDAGAVNWGGYQPGGGGELEGSVSELPSAVGNVNTRTYRWYPGRRYRYRIHRSPERGWRGSITDLETGVETVVRDLWVEGDTLTNPMVWTESFADCGEPPAAVRWSDLEAVTTDGAVHTTSSVRINYQSYADGGCTNTNVTADGDGFIQRTGTERISSVGSVLRLT